MLLVAAGLVNSGILSSQAQNATVTDNALLEASIRDSNFNTQWGGAPGGVFTNNYSMVKYASATFVNKTYYKFDFTGQNPNTNYSLTLTLTGAKNTAYQHCELWALNQEYPEFTDNFTLIWATAQANGTNYGDNTMVTNGTYTATPILDFGCGINQGGTKVVTLPAPWGQYLFNNQLVIALTGYPDSKNNANGARFATNTTTITFQPLTTGTQPPSISAIADVIIPATTTSGAIDFTVNDPQDGPDGLTPVATSSNPGVLPESGILFDGSGTNRSLTITPVGASGVTTNAIVTITVTDAEGNSAQSSFTVTIPPFVSPPVVLAGTNVNYIPPTNTVLGNPVTIPFQIVDTNVAAASLIVTGYAASYTTNLGEISITTDGVAGSTNNCSVTVTPTGSGVGVVTLNVVDSVNSLTDTVSFAVMVLPSSDYAFYDLMNYQPSGSYTASGQIKLFDISQGLWVRRNTTAQSVNLITSVLNGGNNIPGGQAVIRATTTGDSGQVRLIGAPYRPSSHAVLYLTFHVAWADLSLFGAAANYPGNSAGGFVELAADGSPTGISMAAVCTTTNLWPSDTADTGSFNLCLVNETNGLVINNTYAEQIPNYNTGNVVNPPGNPDNVAVSYDVDSGVSTLWVNPPNGLSTDPGVSAQSLSATNLPNVSYIVLRQNSGMGNLLISDLKVWVTYKPVPAIAGVALPSGGNIQIHFTSAPGSGSTASVVACSTVNGTYNTVSSDISELSPGNFVATVPVSGDQMFYRIVQTTEDGPVSFQF